LPTTTRPIRDPLNRWTHHAAHTLGRDRCPRVVLQAPTRMTLPCLRPCILGRALPIEKKSPAFFSLRLGGPVEASAAKKIRSRLAGWCGRRVSLASLQRAFHTRMPRLREGSGYEEGTACWSSTCSGPCGRRISSSEVLGTIATLLAKARSSGRPSYTATRERRDPSPSNRGTAPGKIHRDPCPPRANWSFPSAPPTPSSDLPLRGELEARRVRHLVVTGMMTEACVDTTSRAAISLGYECHSREDATHVGTGGYRRRKSSSITRHIGGPRTSRPHIKVKPAEAVNFS